MLNDELTNDEFDINGNSQIFKTFAFNLETNVICTKCKQILDSVKETYIDLNICHDKDYYDTGDVPSV